MTNKEETLQEFLSENSTNYINAVLTPSPLKQPHTTHTERHLKIWMQTVKLLGQRLCLHLTKPSQLEQRK